MKQSDFKEWVKLLRKIDNDEMIRLIRETPKKYQGLVSCAFNVANQIISLKYDSRKDCPLCYHAGIVTDECLTCLCVKRLGTQCGSLTNPYFKRTRNAIRLYKAEYKHVHG